MGTILCACGHAFSDGEIPCPHLYLLIPDSAIENLVEHHLLPACGAGEDAGLHMGHAITSKGIPTYQCPKCGRLLVFTNGLDQPAQGYRPE
jgi:hypothetical protein